MEGTGRGPSATGAEARWGRGSLGSSSLRRLLGAAITILVLAGTLLSGPAWAEPKGRIAPLIVRAPKVTRQPASATVEEGQSATFEASASGTPEPTVRWEVSRNASATWTAIEGATSDRLVVASATVAETGDEFRASFSSSAGEATSRAAVLTVERAPVATLQPNDVTVEEGQGASFEAAAAGTPAPTVQWELSTNGGGLWRTVAGATSDRLTISDARTTENADQYRATFKNAAGSTTTTAATLTVQRAPAVTLQPVSRTVEVGQTATFEAAASGLPAPSVQWEISTDGGTTWAVVEGATLHELTIPSTTLGQSGEEYRATFMSVAGTARTQAATLNVQAPPRVSEQPASTIVEAGQSATFQAAAAGSPTPNVQWEVSTNGGGTWVLLQGATTDQLTIPSTTVSESGHQYRAVFTSSAGRATSSAATLTVASSQYAAVAWGQNSYGQLGTGALSSFSDVPTPVSGLDFVTSISAGRRHSLALRADGTVVAWGAGGDGQLGDGEAAGSDLPVAVSGLTGVKAISAGGSFSLALLSNGTVMSWGENENGQLGTGNYEESDVPVPVKGITGVVAISAGSEHSLALLSNGTVMSWGEGEEGQLGTGSTSVHDTPVQVKDLSDVWAISAGGDFSLALLSNGTVKAWGSDRYGQLGVEPPEEGFSSVPVQVGGLAGVGGISGGAEHALAMLGNGTVMAWGEDSSGELGDGAVKSYEEVPLQVEGISSAVSVSAGSGDSVALLADGSVQAWGINKFGTLGDGTSGASSDVPVAVLGLGKVASVSAGGFHMLAYGEPIPTVTAVSPGVGPSAGGTRVTLSGVNFTGATAVMFGAKPASSFTITSEGTAEAVAPAGAGTVDVTVRTPAGISPTGAADEYTYVAAPTVTELSVKAGPSAGGTSVTITGTEFTDATAVSFGAGSVTSFEVNSATSITAVSPPGPAGPVDVTVTSVGGSSAISTKGRFQYLPAVEGVTPGSGPLAGHVSVTVSGSGFAMGAGATKFKFGKKAASAVSCASSTSCTMLTPAETAGTVEVTAQVNGVKSPVDEPGDEFTYG
jgi:alpha-tubulin suppressor-like RCC1 family protein